MSGGETTRSRRWRNFRVPFRLLVIVVLIWGLARIVTALLMPGSVTEFAPDEAGYVELVRAVALGGDWITHSYGFGASIWPQGRAMLWPASLLASGGLDAYAAARVVSVIYSTGSALLLVALLWLARRRGAAPAGSPTPNEIPGPRLVSWPVVGIAVFLLLPSHLLWESLGLREAATEFWVMSAVVTAGFLFARPGRWWQRVLWALLIAVEVSLAYQSRGYMAVALTLALAVGVFWFGRERPRLSAALLAGVVIGTVLGLGLSAPAQEPTAQAPTAQEPTAQEPTAQEPTAQEPLEALITGGKSVPSALNPDTYLERGSYQREVSAQYANSAIAVDSCSGAPDPRDLRLCEFTRLPGAAFAVLFRPLWPLDQPSEWSRLAVAASAENLAWLTLVIAVAWVLVRRRVLLTRVLAMSLTYGVLLVAGMAALEGNFGTAFRHKSNLLWVLCAALVVAGPLRARFDPHEVTEPSSRSGPGATQTSEDSTTGSQR